MSPAGLMSMPLTANLTLNGLLTVAPLAGSTNETDCWANAAALMASKPAANTDFIMMMLLLVVFDDDGREFAGHVFGFIRYLDRYFTGNRLVNSSYLAVWIGHHGRLAGVSVLADRHGQWQCAEEVNVEVLAHFFAAAVTEDFFRMAAVSADVHAHVFHDAQDRDADFLEHLQAFARVQQRDVLWRGDDDRAGDRHFLRQRQLNVAGARRHIDNQVVQIAPVGLFQQLLQRLGDHRAAPYHRLVRIDQEADRRHLHAVVFQRLHRFAVLGFRTAFDAQHH